MKFVVVHFIFICLIATMTFSNEISVNAVTGEKIFKDKLMKTCGYTSAKFAQTYTQEKWKRLKDKGFFRISLYKICPKSVSIVKDQWIEPLYVFAYTYASDSGNFPQ